MWEGVDSQDTRGVGQRPAANACQLLNACVVASLLRRNINKEEVGAHSLQDTQVRKAEEVSSVCVCVCVVQSVSPG